MNYRKMRAALLTPGLVIKSVTHVRPEYGGGTVHLGHLTVARVHSRPSEECVSCVEVVVSHWLNEAQVSMYENEGFYEKILHPTELVEVVI